MEPGVVTTAGSISTSRMTHPLGNDPIVGTPSKSNPPR